MTCPSCGKVNPAEAKFCIECGTMLPEEQETTARFEREELIPYEIPSLEIAPAVKFGAKTDLGRVRENNEDKFDFYETEDEQQLAARGNVYLVCDGMGGHAAGQIASELACKTFLREYFGPINASPTDAAKRAAQEANRFIFDVGKTIQGREGMGTTLTALALCQNTAFITHIGDSRCYLLRGEEIRQVTDDHTWVGEQVKLGYMTEEQALQSPYAHVITRACGVQENVEVDVYEMPIEEGDTFLLCSDGLSNHLSGEQMAQVMFELSPSPACVKLVQMALDDGGSDNCTVMIVKVQSLLPVGE